MYKLFYLFIFQLKICKSYNRYNTILRYILKRNIYIIICIYTYVGISSLKDIFEPIELKYDTSLVYNPKNAKKWLPISLRFDLFQCDIAVSYKSKNDDDTYAYIDQGYVVLYVGEGVGRRGWLCIFVKYYIHNVIFLFIFFYTTTNNNVVATTAIFIRVVPLVYIAIMFYLN